MSNNTALKYVITGIGTDVGKTVVSAIFAQALEASYWKPIQAGDLENSDSIKVFNWTEDNVTILKEAFKLSQPMSPHAAALIDGLKIDRESLSLPVVKGNLIIEGAGGVLVPINDDGYLFADLFVEWKLPVIVVSRHYVGSINHTLLTIESLLARNIKIAGIVFVGDENHYTESLILNSTKCRLIARIPHTTNLDTQFIQDQANLLKGILKIEL